MKKVNMDVSAQNVLDLENEILDLIQKRAIELIEDGDAISLQTVAASIICVHHRFMKHTCQEDALTIVENFRRAVHALERAGA